MQGIHHIPVLVQEVVKLLSLKSSDSVIDCTFGGGGHSQAILKKTAPDGKLLGIDEDDEAIKNAKILMSNVKCGERIILVRDNFRNLESIVNQINFRQVRGILLDLGMSSYELDKSGKGFSFMRDEPLDMRFSGEKGEMGKTALEVVNKYSYEDLREIFREFGELEGPGVIANRIVQTRKTQPITTTSMLVRAILSDSRGAHGHSRRDIPWCVSTNPRQMKFLAKVFQAIRIEVNDELNNLQKVLPQALKILEKGGRLAVISYHSLEDRITKQYCQREAKGCICRADLPICQCGQKPSVKIITKKPIVPTKEEIQRNPRARSAKLRVIEKYC